MGTYFCVCLGLLIELVFKGGLVGVGQHEGLQAFKGWGTSGAAYKHAVLARHFDVMAQRQSICTAHKKG